MILDSTPDGVFIIDPQSLRFTYANVGATTQLGYGREDLLDMTPLHVAPDLTEGSLRELVDPVASGELTARTFSTTFRRRDGVDLPVEVSLQLLPSHEKEEDPGVVLVARDRSERLALAETQSERDLLADRERIARDLHDTVIQRLFAAGMSLQAVASRAVLDDVRERIQEVVRELDTTITDIRTTVFALQTAAPSRVRSGVAEVVDEVGESFDGQIQVRFDGPVDTMDDSVVTNLLATLREALTNVMRHASADEVQVEVRVQDENVTLHVVDDGVGLLAEPARQRPDQHGRSGQRSGWDVPDPTLRAARHRVDVARARLGLSQPPVRRRRRSSRRAARAAASVRRRMPSFSKRFET